MPASKKPRSAVVARQRPTTAELDGPIGEGLKPAPYVLVVEDDRDLREALADTLAEHGFEVKVAEDGKEALEIASATPPGLILLDLMMPIIDGWSVQDALARDPALSKIPVIVMTAAGNLKNVEYRGPVFVKPLRMDQLVAAVRVYLLSASALAK